MLKKVSALIIVVTTIFSSTPIFATNDDSTNNTNEITFDKKIGINGFVDCKFDNIQNSGVFREYHNFSSTFDSNSGKSYFKSSSYNYDEFYKNLYISGITIVPCFKNGTDKDNKENKPIKSGDNSTNPESYKTHSNVLYNYSARYGNTIVDKNKLNITQGTNPITGLGYIKYYENWNEPDKTKFGDKAHFSPEEFAAMCSADYDGHEGSLGNTYGIKQADPYSKLVLGGLSSNNNPIDYLNSIKKWCEENRNSKTLPFDVINFHHYSGAKSPESSDFISKANEIIDWKNENAPDKEVWISEFGWDTNISSPNSAPSADSQRDWIIREYLLADRIGLNRAIVNSSRDNSNANSSSPLSTSGLTSQKGKEERKSSWYGVNTLKNTLGGFIFSGIIREESDIYIYKYTNPLTSEDCFVLWCPTSDNKRLDNYELEIGDNNGANLIQLQPNTEYGISSALTVENNTIQINVSETPTFVKVTPSEKTISLNTPKSETSLDANNVNTQYLDKNQTSKEYSPSEINVSATNKESKSSLSIKKIEKFSSIISFFSFLWAMFV